MALILIGDSHLNYCYDIAKKSNGSANFNFNIDIVWKTDIDLVKHLEKNYKEILKNITPSAVLVMCGGYDLAITNNEVDVLNKLKAFITYLHSSSVKFIIVCSLIERKCANSEEEAKANKAVKHANRLLAKSFKKFDKVFFINVRPPGKVGSFIGSDKYHLKNEGYNHIYKRILITLEDRVFPYLSNDGTPISKVDQNLSTSAESNEKKESSLQFKSELSMDERMDEFKSILVQDYKRICCNEDDLSRKLNRVEIELEQVRKQKREIMDAYKRLFGNDISQLNIDS